MCRKLFLIPVPVVIFFVIGYSEAIRCFLCAFPEDGCDDKFSKAQMTTDCDQCYKSKGTNKSEKTVVRGCLEMKYRKNGFFSQSSDDESGEVCLCERDLCNTASAKIGLDISLVLVATAIHLLCALYKT
ncbi:uncharacterized protein LOC127839724 [Dreissena polymorpha]|uniref:uncharacterized protein LOC127839724 n=1 Tax=Dreissena polymorpha TaxID=45954 RepID=UPI0022640DD0|nr:uncharacterized protein LOC127839724 [Dreissena polymorpha]